MRRIWQWKDFSGGLADNPYVGQAGQYQNGSFNIDTQTEPGIVKLTPKLEDYLTLTNIPKEIINLAEFGDSGIVVFSKDGKIYKDTTLTYTNGATFKEVYGATAQYDAGGTLYVYFMTRDVLYKSTTALTAPTSFKTTGDGLVSNTNRKPMINVYGNIYIGDSNKFHKLKNTGVLSTVYTFSANEIITGITFFQDNFYVYTRSNTALIGAVNGRQYVFGATNLEPNSSPTYNTLWKGLPSLGVTNLGSKDYVVTGITEWFSDLYVSSGTQRLLLKSNNEGSLGARQFNGVMTSRLDDVYIGGNYPYNNGFVEGNKDGMGVYKYGSYYPGQQAILQKIIKTPDGEDITCLLANETKLYIGTDNNKVYTYSFDENPNYASTGEIVSLMTDLGSSTSKKTLTEVYVGYDMSNNNISNKGGTITVYASVDNGNYRQIGTVTATSGIGNLKIMPPAITAQAFGKFTKISFKVKFAPNGTTDTPGFTGLVAIFDDEVGLN